MVRGPLQACSPFLCAPLPEPRIICYQRSGTLAREYSNLGMHSVREDVPYGPSVRIASQMRVVWCAMRVRSLEDPPPIAKETKGVGSVLD